VPPVASEVAVAVMSVSGVSLKLIDSPTNVASLHNALLSTVTVWLVGSLIA
jgi:hypothetical protein